MAVHIIMGRPGGGKSYWGLNVIRQRLLETNQYVITNLPVDVGKLNEHIQEKYPEKTIDVCRRVQLLDDQGETKYFFSYRPMGWRCYVPTAKDHHKADYSLDYSRLTQDGSNPDQESETMTCDVSSLGGVLYVIDEAHLFYSARQWKDLGRPIVEYLSQHRKLGDTVLLISQHPHQIDKQLRLLVQDYTVLRNLSYEKVGFFKSLGGRCLKSSYLELPNSMQKPMETGLVTIDVGGLAECYHTAKGVGMGGGGNADIDHQKAKGLPLWSIFIFLGLLLVFVFTVPGWIIQKTIFPGKEKQEMSVPENPSPETTDPIPAAGSDPIERARSLPVPETDSDLQERPMPDEEDEPVYLVGLVMLPGPKVIIHLSDGRKLTEKSPSLQFIHRDWVLVDGQKITSPPYGWKKEPESSGLAGINRRTLKR